MLPGGYPIFVRFRSFRTQASRLFSSRKRDKTGQGRPGGLPYPGCRADLSPVGYRSPPSSAVRHGRCRGVGWRESGCSLGRVVQVERCTGPGYTPPGYTLLPTVTHRVPTSTCAAGAVHWAELSYHGKKEYSGQGSLLPRRRGVLWAG